MSLRQGSCGRIFSLKVIILCLSVIPHGAVLGQFILDVRQLTSVLHLASHSRALPPDAGPLARMRMPAPVRSHVGLARPGGAVPSGRGWVADRIRGGISSW
ncbi:MAG: hypothetical protein NTY37_06775 [Methanothrix sp.]|nr:hypothetical protein [Methanothrix sp.]